MVKYMLEMNEYEMIESQWFNRDMLMYEK